MRNRGWAGKREVSEVSSWLLPRTRALINLLLSSPSKGGWSEGRDEGNDRGKGGEAERGQNRQQTNRDAGEMHRNIL